MKRLILLAVLFVALLTGCGSTAPVIKTPPAPTATATATPSPSPTPTAPQHLDPPVLPPTPTPTPSPVPSPVPFVVLSVDLTVSPATRLGIPCGTTATFTYTATFHVTGSGTVQFNYTTNNGRQIFMGSLNFLSGATVEAFSFTATGPVTIDDTFPGTAGVFVTSPNEVRSPVVIVSGTCSPA